MKAGQGEQTWPVRQEAAREAESPEEVGQRGWLGWGLDAVIKSLNFLLSFECDRKLLEGFEQSRMIQFIFKSDHSGGWMDS